MPASKKRAASRATSTPIRAATIAPRRPAGQSMRKAFLASPAGLGSAASPSAESAKPIAKSRKPTATTWAQNHVVPIAEAYQRTVPRPRKRAVAVRTPERIGR